MPSFLTGAAVTAIDYAGLFQGAVDEAKGAVTQVTPLGVTIFSILLGIGIGIKVLKRVAK